MPMMDIEPGIDAALARQREWGTDNFRGVFYHGKQIVAPEEVENEAQMNDLIDDRVAEEQLAQLLAQGITRQGGNY